MEGEVTLALTRGHATGYEEGLQAATAISSSQVKNLDEMRAEQVPHCLPPYYSATVPLCNCATVPLLWCGVSL